MGRSRWSLRGADFGGDCRDRRLQIAARRSGWMLINGGDEPSAISL